MNITEKNYTTVLKGVTVVFAGSMGFWGGFEMNPAIEQFSNEQSANDIQKQQQKIDNLKAEADTSTTGMYKTTLMPTHENRLRDSVIVDVPYKTAIQQNEIYLQQLKQPPAAHIVDTTLILPLAGALFATELVVLTTIVNKDIKKLFANAGTALFNKFHPEKAAQQQAKNEGPAV